MLEQCVLTLFNSSTFAFARIGVGPPSRRPSDGAQAMDGAHKLARCDVHGARRHRLRAPTASTAPDATSEANTVYAHPPPPLPLMPPARPWYEDLPPAGFHYDP